MPPAAKKQKKAKLEFVPPPGGEALETPLPGRLLKDDTGDVARWWPNIKAGKAAYVCNVQGVVWFKQTSKWMVQHISAATNKRKTLGYFAAFADACPPPWSTARPPRAPSKWWRVSCRLALRAQLLPSQTHPGDRVCARHLQVQEGVFQVRRGAGAAGPRTHARHPRQD